MHYSVAIRTLGTAGEKYEQLIHSIEAQTIPADKIVVYIAEGYPLPKQVGREIYVRCKKGMVHQRSLPYDEIDSEYLLLCDDDICLQHDSVEMMYKSLERNSGSVIAANVFNNHLWDLRERFLEAIFHGIYPSWTRKYAFRIRRNGCFCYCTRPQDVMESQSFAGPCFFTKKEVLLSVSFHDERWMDQCRYALFDDQLLAYKLFRCGYKILVHSCCGVEHLDAGTGHVPDKNEALADAQFLHYVIWHRSIFEPDNSVEKIIDCICFYSRWSFRYILAILSRISGRNSQSSKILLQALRKGKKFVNSEEYSRIPKWIVIR